MNDQRVLDAPPTHAGLLRQAVPIILAGASVPLLGMVDTAVIGHYGSAGELAALAVGALLFNCLYWGFGFLRMATTGFVARAAGAADGEALRAAIGRPVLLGGMIGLSLWCLYIPLSALFHHALGSDATLMEASHAYVSSRIWGAPAALMLYALCGTLIGQGRGRALLAVQLTLNGLNALLDIGLASWLGLGLSGIGYGTAIAEWTSCLLAMWLVMRSLRKDVRCAMGQRWHWLRDRKGWREIWVANTDLLLRTGCLLAGFAWFARQGAQMGEGVLAANHLLLQLVTFSAFFLDGFAHVAETHVGKAMGRGDRKGLQRVAVMTTQLALASAILLAAGVSLGGGLLVHALTDLADVQAVAAVYLPWVALYVLISVGAFQLDGMFIGAGATGPMRWSAFWALLALVVFSLPATVVAGNHGLWSAMVLFVLVRALYLFPVWTRMTQGAGPGAAD